MTELSLAPGRADSLLEDDGQRALTATARLQTDVSSKVVLVGSGLLRAESDVAAKSGAAGVAVGYAPFPRVSIWTEANAHFQAGGGGTSLIFVNETSFEAVRGVWLKLSPQGRTGHNNGPGVFRWSAAAVLLPRTHWNANVTFYRDRTEGSDTTLRTLLIQLHLYL